MKIKNLILLACVLNMPIQQALAESAKGFVPASAARSNVATPNKAPTISNGRTVKGPVSIAGPGSSPSSGTVQKPTVAGGVNAVVNPMLKPNLIITKIGPRDEICSDACSSTLKKMGLGRSCSPIRIYIKNIGSADAGAFDVRFSYQHWEGYKNNLGDRVSGLARGRTTYVELHGEDHPAGVGIYKLNEPVTAQVDSNNAVPESNENDNKKTVYLR